jgi:toxin CcdB
MAKLDVYRIGEQLVVEVQHDLMATLRTTVVVPLYPLDRSPRPMRRLNPVFEFGGAPYVMATQLIASIPKRELGAAVGALAEGQSTEITNALDMLFTGV